MTLNSDIEALEAIAEEAEDLLTRLELLEGDQKSELLMRHSANNRDGALPQSAGQGRIRSSL